MESLVNRYHPEGVYDEMFDGEEVRSSYGLSYELMSDMPNTEFIDRADYVRSTYLDQGVTFDGRCRKPLPTRCRAAHHHGRRLGADRGRRPAASDGAGGFPRRRSSGSGKVFGDGVIPRRIVATSTHYHRVAHGIRPPNGVRIHVSGTDLVRDASGVFRVLEDNVRIPAVSAM